MPLCRRCQENGCEDWYCEKCEDEIMNDSPNKRITELEAQVAELQRFKYAVECDTGAELASKLSRHVHDRTENTPHDIGLTLMDVIRNHLKSQVEG